MASQDYNHTVEKEDGTVTQLRWSITNGRGTHTNRRMWLPSSCLEVEEGKKVELSPITDVMVIFHGLHEHCGRYDEFATAIVRKSGMAIFSLDWMGHGMNDGRRGKATQESFFDDGESLVDDIKKGNFPESSKVGPLDRKNFYLVGHSMGGCIALNFLIHHPDMFSASMLSAPLCDIKYGQPSLIACLATPLLSCLACLSPTAEMAMAERIDVTDLCHNEEKMKTFLDDDLNNFNKVNNQLSYEMAKMTKTIQARCGTITTPLLIMHSEADPVVPQPPSETVLGRVKTNDTKYCKYEKFFHEMINEGDDQLNEIVSQTLGWAQTHQGIAN